MIRFQHFVMHDEGRKIIAKAPSCDPSKFLVRYSAVHCVQDTFGLRRCKIFGKSGLARRRILLRLLRILARIGLSGQLATGCGDITAPAGSYENGIIGLAQDLLKGLGPLPRRALVIGAGAFVVGE